jgi:branched-chain amino acid transport system ATP-binding protein
LGADAAFLSIEGLSVHYGALEAVRGMSLELGRGAIVSLLGANGSGKSTVLRAISGLRRPSAGRIWFDGERIDGLSPPKVVQRGIAQVPEGRRLFPHMTVLENLKMGAYSRRDRGVQQTLGEVFTFFPVLEERQSDKAGPLSGGVQEMLAIARGLMPRPRLLLMDEPLQGLAPLVVEEIERIIRELNATVGLSLILVEHNVHIALGLADKVYILDSGRVAHVGSPEEMSQTEYVQKVYLAG